MKVLFNPEGRLMVFGYPSGIVQVLDPATGKEFYTIETQRGLRSTLNYIQASKDFRTLFVFLENRNVDSVQVGERKTHFLRYEGETRVYDLGTGKQKELLRGEPRRGVMSLVQSPDASRIVTTEVNSGPLEEGAKLDAIYLWDLATRQAVKLRDGYGDKWFSPDGKTVFITVNDKKDKTGVMYTYSAATGKETGKRTNPDGPWPGFIFSPDGGRVAASGVNPTSKKPFVRLYDPLTFEPKALLEVGEDKDGQAQSLGLKFSPDGKHLAGVKKSTVFLWDVETRKLLKSWRLDTPGKIKGLEFDWEGRRLAVLTTNVPPEMEKLLSDTSKHEDFPQPKVLLFDVNSDQVETIVCPHGWSHRLALSRDGNFLAVGGTGTTHIFDVGKK